MALTDDYFKELIDTVKSRHLTKNQLSRLKIKLCTKYGLKDIPTDIEVFLNAGEKDSAIIKRALQTKPVRSLSGVAVCAIMSYPFRCPHGECLMCPSKTSEGVPQSYTGKEPAAMRGIRNLFDSYLQVFNRLEQYIASGHVPDKVELIVMGGTFPSFELKYQEDFVMYALKAMNDFSKIFFSRGKNSPNGKPGTLKITEFKKFFELPGKVGSPERTLHIHAKLLKMKGGSTLAKEQRRNEKSVIKCIGMTIETRPDYAKLPHANNLLKLGCTRVELGVQSTYDDVLKKINRGHDVNESVRATQTLKNLGFKINFHVMPGLPGSDRQKDLQMLRQLFSDDRFRPDMLKIYPCMVVKESKLYGQWEKGLFTPISTMEASGLIAEFKKSVPEYCRIMRVQRDIPTNATAAGVDRTNLRQYVQEIMKKNKTECKCIRCREIGRSKEDMKKISKVPIKAIFYSASKGKELFISAEHKNALYGFCRLRLPLQSLRKEITKDSALVRELHVYGETTAIGEKGSKGGVQHRGLGKRLLAAAEKAAKAAGKKKIVVISGIGARDYYRKLGYSRQGPYMVKRLR
jgi:elongator complex protein 3